MGEFPFNLDLNTLSSEKNNQNCICHLAPRRKYSMYPGWTLDSGDFQQGFMWGRTDMLNQYEMNFSWCIWLDTSY